jgi:energy-coupling factor transporter ATP-binding protein EcfA2
MKIISADERLNEKRGVKALIIGPSGVGKTSLLRTLDQALLDSTLFIDVEAGDLAVQDLAVPTVRIDDWKTARDLACRLGGPHASFPSSAPYSQAHFNALGGTHEDLDRYDTLFVDSITAVSRLSFRWAEQQPEARSEKTGAKDLRGAYGLHAREMLLWLNQLQHARARHVIFVGILERLLDDFNRHTGFQVQLEGQKTSREIGAIVDEVIVMDWIDFGDHKPVRAFIRTQPNRWGYPAKDRSGRLEQVEPPDLQKLLAKLIPVTGDPAKAAHKAREKNHAV